MRAELPSGTVTFLFTDIEGSTRLLHALGPDAYAEALAEHRRVLRAAFAAHDGVEVDTQGDAFFVAFPTAPGAVAAAEEGRRALEPGPIRVRMGLHTGTPTLTAEGYVGVDVHRGARVAALAHGGQVILTEATAALLDGTTLADLGRHRLKDFDGPARLLQLGSTLDVDLDGEVNPLTDSVLVMRWGFGMRGQALVVGALDETHCERCSAAEIEAYLDGLDGG